MKLSGQAQGIAVLLALSTLIACREPTSNGNEPVTGVIIETVFGRTILTYLPPSYATDSMKKFPVIYFHDGETALGHLNGLHAEHILESLVQAGIVREAILVGIASSFNRTGDYLPYHDDWVNANWGPYTPQAREFSDLIVQKIVPYVDGKYRTIAEASSRAVVGFSFGGLLATWQVFQYDSVFSMAGGFSPSYWVSDYEFFREAGIIPKKNIKLWFDIGTGEWNYYVPLLDTLIAKGYVYGTNLFYYEVVGGTHDLTSWRPRVQYPLIAFLGNSATTITDWVINVEVIKSAVDPGRFFLRLNPVVTMDNGLVFSASTAATYTLVNTLDGTVNKDGSFAFSSTNDLMVDVSYEGLSQRVVIRYEDIESRKQQLKTGSSGSY